MSNVFEASNQDKVSTERTFLNYIDGEWVPSSQNKTLKSINPANEEEIVGYVQSSTEEDVFKAVEVAKSATVSWRKLSSVKRSEYLRKAADLIESRKTEIAETATKEMGKTLAEATGEVVRAATILRYYAGEGSQSIGDLVPSQNSKNLLYTTRTPVGVVGVISPWNFPIAIPIWKIAPALVYGNTVVFKPATETAITAAKIVEVLHDSGLPKGVLNFVTGRGSDIGDTLLYHNDIDAITFTGSNSVGKHVAEAAVSRGAKYQLEMGGKNPAIVLEDADLNLAAELTVNGAMKHTGQKCTATSRVFVQRSIYEQFKALVMEKVKDIKVGSGLERDVYMGPLVSKDQLNKVKGYIQKGLEEGADLIFGGHALQGEPFEKGYFIEPTVFENVTNDMTIAQEEIFGPVLSFIKVDSYDEALKLANDVPFGLSASLFTRDIAKALEFVNGIEAGMVKVNGESAGVEPQTPFGGLKQSSSHSR